MSAGRSRSPRSGGKARSPKKPKRAKGEFHAPKRRIAPSKESSKEDARKRLVESLEHLGHQKLSTEPGGYDLQSWLKSLKRSLDDFEEKVGKTALTRELHDKGNEIGVEFSKYADSSQVDSEIEAVRKEEGEIRARLKEEEERISSRLSAIGGEKTSKSLDLEEERKKLHQMEEERKSVSFFSKLMGRSGPSTEPQQKKVRELEGALKMLEEETLNLQTVRRSIEGAKDAAGGIYEDLWKRLGDIESKLVELDAAREVKLQLKEEREKAAEELRKLAGGLKLEEPEEA
ncbi:MAG: hypothetical protein JRN09_06690 [Nitrososphaerota archaeon]|nr:hypothetical protein [Nitrososphaerota archaeon]